MIPGSSKNVNILWTTLNVPELFVHFVQKHWEFMHFSNISKFQIFRGSENVVFTTVFGPGGSVPTSGPPVRHLGATGPPRGGHKSRGGKGAGAAIGGLGNRWARGWPGAEPPGPKTVVITTFSEPWENLGF